MACWEFMIFYDVDMTYDISSSCENCDNLTLMFQKKPSSV